jgi:hypothetical protein
MVRALATCKKLEAGIPGTPHIKINRRDVKRQDFRFLQWSPLLPFCKHVWIYQAVIPSPTAAPIWLPLRKLAFDVFCAVTPCSLLDHYRRVGGTYSAPLQGGRILGPLGVRYRSPPPHPYGPLTVPLRNDRRDNLTSCGINVSTQ